MPLSLPQVSFIFVSREKSNKTASVRSRVSSQKPTFFVHTARCHRRFGCSAFFAPVIGKNNRETERAHRERYGKQITVNRALVKHRHDVNRVARRTLNSAPISAALAGRKVSLANISSSSLSNCCLFKSVRFRFASDLQFFRCAIAAIIASPLAHR